MAEIHTLTEHQCRQQATTAIRALIALKTGPAEHELATRIEELLFLLGEEHLIADDRDADDLDTDELHELIEEINRGQ